MTISDSIHGIDVFLFYVLVQIKVSPANIGTFCTKNNNNNLWLPSHSRDMKGCDSGGNNCRTEWLKCQDPTNIFQGCNKLSEKKVPNFNCVQWAWLKVWPWLWLLPRWTISKDSFCQNLFQWSCLMKIHISSGKEEKKSNYRSVIYYIGYASI